MSVIKALPALLFCIAGLGAMGYGSFSGWVQHQTVVRGVPVDALVVESQVERIPFRNWTRYEPRVSFWYKFDDKNYESDSPMPTTTYGSRHWAQKIVKQFSIGNRTTAYVNPARPSQAYLVRYYGAIPYTAFLFGATLFGGGVAVLFELRNASSRRLTPTPSEDGWFELPSPRNRRQKGRAYIIAGIAWQLLGLSAWAHYWLVGESPISPLFIAYAIAYVAIGYGIIIAGAYHYSIARR